MTHESAKPLDVGTINALIILTGQVGGAFLGILRNEPGASVLLTGGVASARLRHRTRARGDQR